MTEPDGGQETGPGLEVSKAGAGQCRLTTEPVSRE